VGRSAGVVLGSSVGGEVSPGADPAHRGCYNPPVAIDRIPLPSSVPGRLYATGFTDVGPDPDRALGDVEADTLLCLLTRADIDQRFPPFHGWLEANLLTGRSWWFPIDDGGVADDDEMLALVEAVTSALGDGRCLVTHCWAGIGRTSLVCALAVVALTDAGLDAALALVRAARLGAGPENPVQRSHLERLARRLGAGGWHSDTDPPAAAE
jgi:hypothetical protein